MPRTLVPIIVGLIQLLSLSLCFADNTRVTWNWEPTPEDYIDAEPGVRILEEYVTWLAETEQRYVYGDTATKKQLQDFLRRWADFGKVGASAVNERLGVNILSRDLDTANARLDLFEKAFYIFGRQIKSLPIALAFETIIGESLGFYFASASFHEEFMKGKMMDDLPGFIQVISDYLTLDAQEYHFMEKGLFKQLRSTEIFVEYEREAMGSRFSYYGESMRRILFMVLEKYGSSEKKLKEKYGFSSEELKENFVSAFIEAISSGPTELRGDFGGYLRLFKVLTQRFTSNQTATAFDQILLERMAMALLDEIQAHNYPDHLKQRDLMVLFEFMVFPRLESIRPYFLPLVHKIIASGNINSEILKFLNEPSWWTATMEAFERNEEIELGVWVPVNYVRIPDVLTAIEVSRFESLYGTNNPDAAAKTISLWKSVVESKSSYEEALARLNCEVSLSP